MSRNLSCIVLAVLLTTLFGCGSGSAREVGEGYLSALARLDFEGAAQYVAEEGRSNFDILKRLYSSLPPEQQSKFRVTDWKIVSEDISGETATLDFLFDGAQRGQLVLKRVRGLWKVDHRQTF